MRLRSILPRLLAALLCGVLPSVRAQTAEDAKFATQRRVVQIGNVGMSFSTRGYIGEMFGSGLSQRPSFEYPLNSRIEHLWMAGVWVGALDAYTGEPMVSSGVVDATLSASAQVPSGFEFAPKLVGGSGGTIEDKSAALLISRNPLQPNFRIDALADEHFIVRYNDRNASGADSPSIHNPHVPLDVQVRCDILAYSSKFADDFIILLFEVENVGEKFLKDLYLGWYVEPLVVNRGKLTFPASGGDLFFGDVQGVVAPDGKAQQTAQQHFDRDALLSDPDAHLLYRLDADGDRGNATSWSGVRFLGADAPEGFDINYRQWQYSTAGGIPHESDYGDAARYAYMRGCNPDLTLEALLEAFENGCRTKVIDAGPSVDPDETDFTVEANWVGLWSVGPWPTLNPGQKASFAVAMVAGVGPDEMLSSSAVAQAYFDDGFRQPSGPPSPALTVIPRNGAVELRWKPGEFPSSGVYDAATASPEYHRSQLTNEYDFQGYRIYRINGETVSGGDPFEQASLLAEFDITERRRDDGSLEPDRTGFNTGLPAMDGEERVYVDRNVLNGFKYRYSVTSYSAANAETGQEELESGFNENSVVAIPGSGPTGTNPDPGATGPGKVSVYPNPYRAASIYDRRDSDSNVPRELGRKIYFSNVPANATIDIYTIAGTRIVRIEHHDSQRSLVEWNVMSQETAAIAPGLYIWSVEDLDSGERQRGKLVILK